MASDDIHAVHSWAVAVVRPPTKGGGHLLLVRRRRRLSSLFGGGGLRRINAFWQLPRPLCWVPVRGPSECYLAACHCVRRPVLGGLDFFTARKGDIFLEYSWALACVCLPEGGPEVLVVHNGHCVA
jgi:hypothetical protein